MTDIDTLFDAIRSSWHYDTAAPGSCWNSAVPATGQCAVTALVVQDYFGGDLLRCLNPDTQNGDSVVSHYWNRLPSGREVDLTRGQFWRWEPRDIVVRQRDYVLSFEETAIRYERLRTKVYRQLGGSATLVLSR